MKKILAQLRQNPLFKKYEIYIAPAASVLIVLILVLAVVVPNIFQYIETNNKIHETEEKITFFQKKAQVLKAIKKDDYKNGLSSSLIILPNDKEAPAAIAQLYYIVNSTGVNIQNIAFADGSGTDGKSFRMNLEIDGTLSGLTNFILKVKESPRLMRIASLEVSKQGGGDNIFASINLSAYFEPLPTVSTNLDQEVIPPTEKDLEILSRLSTTSFPIISENSSYSGAKGKTNPFR